MHNRFPYRGLHGNPLWIVAHGMIAMSLRIEESGKFWFSITELKGKTWFRISPVNFRTRAEHIDQLLASLEQECRRGLFHHRWAVRSE